MAPEDDDFEDLSAKPDPIKPPKKADPKKPANPRGLDLMRKKLQGKRIQTAIERIRHNFGKGSVNLLSGVPEVHTHPTAIPALDAILGVKGPSRRGFPLAMYTEISGENAGGKTILGLYLLSRLQRSGRTCGFVDMEHSLDAEHAIELGVDYEALVYARPRNGEEARDLTLELGRVLDALVVDSWGAFFSVKQVPEEKKTAKAKIAQAKKTPASRANLINETLIGLIDPMERGLTTIGLNQVRDAFSAGFSWQPEKDTTGGNFLKHFQGLHLQVGKRGTIKQGDAKVGRWIFVRIKKSKYGPDGLYCQIPFFFSGGISPEYSAVEMGLAVKTLKKKGGTAPGVYFGPQFLGQDSFAARDFLMENQEIQKQLYDELVQVGQYSRSNDRDDLGQGILDETDLGLEDGDFD